MFAVGLFIFVTVISLLGVEKISKVIYDRDWSVLTMGVLLIVGVVLMFTSVLMKLWDLMP